MLILDATNRSLEVVLAGTVTTAQPKVVTSHVDVTTSTYTPGTTVTDTNDTTAVTAAAAPAASTQRQIKLLTVYNADSTSATVTVQYNANSTVYPIARAALAAGDTLVYADGEGFRVLSDGAIQTAETASGSGDVSAASNFGTDNRLIRSDGTSKGVQASGVTLDDSDNLTGVNNVTGSDTNLVTGTAGTSGDMAMWNGDGDVVDGPTPPTGTIIGTTDTQTLTNKTIDGDNNTLSNLDLGNEVDWAAAADVSDASAFASGDKLLIFEDGAGFRKIDYDDLPTGSFSITGLTEVNPALDDLASIADTSDSSNNKKISLDRTLALAKTICEGRLTLTTGTPVTTSDVSSASTVFFTPFHGNRVRLYDGTRWLLYTFTERSLSLSSLTDAKNYDVFLYDNSGTLTLELSAAWTNDTTRADALTTQDGVYVKSSATTRLYLGTIRTTGTTTTEDSQTKRFLWNNYNRVERFLWVEDTTDAWTYATATTWRAANASTANRFEFVRGINEDLVEARVACIAGSATAHYAAVGVGLDSTTVNSAQKVLSSVMSGNPIAPLSAAYMGYPALGYHYLQWIEKLATANSTSFYGDNGTFNAITEAQSGMFGRLWG